jgi:type VI protein secretion system component VasK
MRAVLSKYPFTPAATAQATLADVNSVFKPKEGALWAFVDANLQKVVVRQGGQYVPAPGGAGGITINPVFLGFLNRAAQFSETAYANNSPDPHLTFSVKAVPTADTDTMKVVVNGQTAEFTSANAATPKTFSWPGSAQNASLAVSYKGTSPYEIDSAEGLWAIFKLMGDANTRTGSQVEWIMETGKPPHPVLRNGQPITARLDITANPPVLDKGYFAGLSCVAEVAKP